MAEQETVRIVGIVASLRSSDVSKRAGVVNLKTYLKLSVERTDPPEVRALLGDEASFIGDGALEVSTGARVEVTSHVGPSHGPSDPLRIYTLRPVP